MTLKELKEQVKTHWKTWIEHTVGAIAGQLILWPVFGLFCGGAMAVAFFFGREVSQHEYKEMRKRKKKTLNSVPFGHGLWNHWTLDSVMDVVVPAIECTLVWLVSTWI
jgi:hypothetical protein